MASGRKKIGLVVLALALLAGAWQGYNRLVSPTRIALVNYEDFQVARVFKSNENPLIKVETVPLEELERVTDYDLVLFFGRALNRVYQFRSCCWFPGKFT